MGKVNEPSEVTLFHKFMFYGLFICWFPTEIRKSVKWSYYTFTFFISTFIMLGSIVTLVNNMTLNLYKLQIIMRLFFSICTVSLFIYFRAFQHEVQILKLQFDRNSPIYIGEEEMKITGKKFIITARNDSIIFGIVVLTGTVAGIWATIQDQNLYDFSYLYLCSLTDGQSAIRFCISEGSWGHFVLNNIMAVIFMIYQAAIMHTAELLMITALVGMTSSVQRYDDLLSDCVEKVKMLDKSDATEDCLALTVLIRYQQKVIQYIEEVRLISRIPIACHVILFYVMAVSFVVPIASQRIQSLYLNVPYIMIAVYIIYLHHTLCEQWQTVNSAEEHFRDTMLEFPWYERNMKFQKLYLMALQLNQKSVQIKVFGLYNLNLKFFAANMNRLYTLVNLMLLKFRL